MIATVSTSVLGGADAVRSVLLAAIIEHFGINKLVSGSVPEIKAAVGQQIRESIVESDEYAPLVDAALWHQLGIVDPRHAIAEIIEQIANSVVVEAVSGQGSPGFVGGFKITILPADYHLGLLSLPVARYTTTNSKGVSHQIEWLEWLLTAGTATLIADYTYIRKDNKSSRTGIGLMVKSNKGWGIPAEFAGTLDDNWITRALKNGVPGMLNAVSITVDKVL